MTRHPGLFPRGRIYARMYGSDHCRDRAITGRDLRRISSSPTKTPGPVRPNRTSPGEETVLDMHVRLGDTDQGVARSQRPFPGQVPRRKSPNVTNDREKTLLAGTAEPKHHHPKRETRSPGVWLR
jgi:hypothetical protein